MYEIISEQANIRWIYFLAEVCLFHIFQFTHKFMQFLFGANFGIEHYFKYHGMASGYDNLFMTETKG